MIGVGLTKLFIYLIVIYLFLITVEDINNSLKNKK
jgi:hypothetical protein